MQICTSIANESYDEDHFTVAISLPVSLALRNHSIGIFLSNKIEDFDSDDVVPIKQAWKWLFPIRLEQKIGKKFVTGNNCEFYIELLLDFVNDNSELEQMRKMCQGEYSMRAKNQRKYHMGLVTRVGAEKSLESVSEKLFRSHYSVPPTRPQSPLTWKVILKHDSAYVAGKQSFFDLYPATLKMTTACILMFTFRI
jgi:hypothetical protein